MLQEGWSGNCDSNSIRGKKPFFSPKYLDGLWDRPRRSFPSGKVTRPYSSLLTYIYYQYKKRRDLHLCTARTRMLYFFLLLSWLEIKVSLQKTILWLFHIVHTSSTNFAEIWYRLIMPVCISLLPLLSQPNKCKVTPLVILYTTLSYIPFPNLISFIQGPLNNWWSLNTEEFSSGTWKWC
jgi:hypothetical protein